MDVEDIIQETLLAIHLKRHTWDTSKPLGPWVMAISQNKIVDAFRRRGRKFYVPLEFVAETLEAPASESHLERHDVSMLLKKLKPREQYVVTSIALEEASISDTASALGLSEGAARVLLHRTLKKLAALYRSKEIED
jgi:RNA polymerase sigma-70 factor (ECF subfamily)